MRRNSRALFRERLYREGSLNERRRRTKELCVENPDLTPKEAYLIACREMGYQGPKKEHEIDRLYRASGRANHFQQVLQASQKRFRRKMRKTEYSKAFDKLDNNAPIEKEMDWVQSHPRVTEALEQIGHEDAEPIKLTARDITDASNGPAPSKGAVNKLLVAIKDPLKWHNSLLSEHRKKSSGGGSTDPGRESVTDDIAWIESMIGEDA